MSLELIGIAVAPGLAIVIYIYFRDKYDREPFVPLFVSFVLGAFTIIPAASIESALIGESVPGSSSLWMCAVEAFLFVGLVEEWVKYVVLKRYSFKHPAFDEPFDGIVYAVMVSMGFATAENILYVLQHGFGTGIMRMFTAVPMHAAVAVMMGYYVGSQKFEPTNKLLGLKGLLVAAFFHGAYDFWLFQKWDSSLYLLAFVVLWWAIRLARKAMDRQVENSPFKPSGMS